MIIYKDSSEINKEKWDAAIHSSLDPAIYAYSWYLDTVCVKWGALIQDDYAAVFPLAFNKKYGISYIYQPNFTRYFGVFSKQVCSKELIDQFLNAIPIAFKYVNLNLNFTAISHFKDYSSEKKIYQMLLLNSDYGIISKQYSDNTKRNIKKARKANLKISETVSPYQIVKLFRDTKGEQLHTLTEADYMRLKNLMENAFKGNNGKMVAVYKEDQLYAAAFFLYSDKRFVFLKSGVTEEGRTSGAMHFLMDHFIRMHSNKADILDFGGSSVESVARFYRSFGASDCVYLQLEKKRFFKLLKIMKWIKSFKR